MWEATKCKFCGENFVEEAVYTSHMHRYHVNRPDFRMDCGHRGCIQSFKSYKSRMKHVQIHRQQQPIDVPMNLDHNDSEQDPHELNASDQDALSENAFATENNENNMEIDTPTRDCLPVSKEFAEAQFLMSLRAQKVTFPIINSVINHTKLVVEASMQDLQAKIVEELRSHDGKLSEETLSGLVAQYSQVFVGMDTKFLQDKFFRQNMSMIEPKLIQLNAKTVRMTGKSDGPNRCEVLKYDSFFYVSILDVLKTLFGNEHYVKLLQPMKGEGDDVLRDCFDGSLFKENPILSADPEAVALLFYADGVNFVDTASSRPVKFTMFYFHVLNLRRELRSSLSLINLVMAVDTMLIDSYGMNEFLKPIVEEVKVLQEGLELPNGKILKGTALGFSGDNAAAHALGRFKEGFTANRACRRCNRKIDEIRCACVDDLSVWRTPEEHDIQVGRLEAATTKAARDALSTEFGVNGRSELNSIPHFHVVNGLPPDPFHDILEGCLKTSVQKLLRHYLIVEKIMTLATFNEKLNGFDYGYSETRPTTILDSHLGEGGSLHQTGIQLWSLATILPLILEPLVEADDEYWINYVCLLRIVSLVYAREISLGEIDLLEGLIEDYLAGFQKLYRNLIPKQHFLLHYPNQILMWGPLGTYDTIRMEGKHKYFSDLMRKFKCYKNPSFTMATQHQLNQAHLLSGELLKSPEFGPIKSASVFRQEPFHFLLPDEEVIQSMPWFSADGVKYVSLQCLIVLGFNDELPKFGSVHKIVLLRNEVNFICKDMLTEDFDTYKNMYRVSRTKNFSLIRYADLKVKAVFHVHNCVNGSFVIVRRNFREFF